MKIARPPSYSSPSPQFGKLMSLRRQHVGVIDGHALTGAIQAPGPVDEAQFCMSLALMPSHSCAFEHSAEAGKGLRRTNPLEAHNGEATARRQTTPQHAPSLCTAG